MRQWMSGVSMERYLCTYGRVVFVLLCNIVRCQWRTGHAGRCWNAAAIQVAIDLSIWHDLSLSWGCLELDSSVKLSIDSTTFAIRCRFNAGRCIYKNTRWLKIMRLLLSAVHTRRLKLLNHEFRGLENLNIKHRSNYFKTEHRNTVDVDCALRVYLLCFILLFFSTFNSWMLLYNIHGK